MSKAKTSKKHTRAWYAIIVVCIVLFGLAFLSFIEASVNSKNEERGFITLRQDMKALQVKFNDVDSGWEYNESCRGRGGDFDRDIPSSCAASITNKTVDFPSNHSENIKMYGNIIEAIKSFDQISDIQIDNLGTYNSTYDYINLKETNCALETYHDAGRTHMTLGCIAPATKFHYQRHDIQIGH